MQKLLFMSVLAGLLTNVCFSSTMNTEVQDNLIKIHGAKKLFNLPDNEGNTPAHLMAIKCMDEYYNNPKNIAKMILALDKGAFNPFIENNEKRTPRGEAFLRGCQIMSDLLLEYEEAYRLYYQDQIGDLSKDMLERGDAIIALETQGITFADGGRTMIMDGDRMSEKAEDVEIIRDALGRLYKK